MLSRDPLDGCAPTASFSTPADGYLVVSLFCILSKCFKYLDTVFGWICSFVFLVTVSGSGTAIPRADIGLNLF